MRRASIVPIPSHFVKQQSMNKDTIISETYDFELISPMFGGDTKSWQLDTKNPVRSTSVKGQLRFWWRTMQSEIDVNPLLFKENERWGGSISDQKIIKSPVSIAITKQTEIQTETVKSNAKGKALGTNVIPNYVLFPVTENVTKKEENIAIVTHLKFTLLISYPEKYQKEVLDTLTLWTLFGGVGARTRRGAGSLYCSKLLQNIHSKTDIKTWLDKLSGHQMTAQKYPRITGSSLFVNDSNDGGNSQSIWKSLLIDYGQYRQDRREPSNGSRSPGRSYWPEPDAIRRLTNTHASNHEPEHVDGNWFPRAAFGLPILTTFSTLGDPTKDKSIHLEPDIPDLDKSERYPSPLILKVIKLTNGQILSCGLLLNQQFPERLKLVANGTYPINSQQLPSASADKQMKTNEPLLANESIYQHLARSLDLEEVK